MCVVQLVVVVEIMLSCVVGIRGGLKPHLHVQPKGLYLPSAHVPLPSGDAQTQTEHVQALISEVSRLLAALQAKRPVACCSYAILLNYGLRNAQQSSVAVFSLVANKMNKQQSLCTAPPQR